MTDCVSEEVAVSKDLGIRISPRTIQLLSSFESSECVQSGVWPSDKPALPLALILAYAQNFLLCT